jgi:hypothetical protein
MARLDSSRPDSERDLHEHGLCFAGNWLKWKQEPGEVETPAALQSHDPCSRGTVSPDFPAQLTDFLYNQLSPLQGLIFLLRIFKPYIYPDLLPSRPFLRCNLCSLPHSPWIVHQSVTRRRKSTWKPATTKSLSILKVFRYLAWKPSSYFLRQSRRESCTW